MVPDYGACVATDHIMVDGLRVGWMYREEPHAEVDSGWRFFSGAESEAYLDDPDHSGIYAVNTVANYDPEIIPFLDEPLGSAFERGPDGRLSAAADPARNELFPPAARSQQLNPRYRAVTGAFPLSDGWSIQLPLWFNHREEERRVFWRPGLTLLIAEGRVVHVGATARGEVARMKLVLPHQAHAIEEIPGERIARFAYRTTRPCRDEDGARLVYVFNGYVSRGEGYVDIEGIADLAADLDVARQAWLSVDHVAPV